MVNKKGPTLASVGGEARVGSERETRGFIGGSEENLVLEVVRRSEC